MGSTCITVECCQLSFARMCRPTSPLPLCSVLHWSSQVSYQADYRLPGAPPVEEDLTETKKRKAALVDQLAASRTTLRTLFDQLTTLQEAQAMLDRCRHLGVATSPQWLGVDRDKAAGVHTHAATAPPVAQPLFISSSWRKCRL